MEIRIKCQGVEESPWMKAYLVRQLLRFERYLTHASLIFIELTHGPDESSSFMSIKLGQSYFTFKCFGGDIFEAFTKTFEEAGRCMRREHQKQLNRIHRKLIVAKAINE